MVKLKIFANPDYGDDTVRQKLRELYRDYLNETKED